MKTPLPKYTNFLFFDILENSIKNNIEIAKATKTPLDAVINIVYKDTIIVPNKNHLYFFFIFCHLNSAMLEVTTP